MSGPIDEAKVYVQSAPIVGADESGNKAGKCRWAPIPTTRKHRLWVAVTPLLSFFQVMLARSTAAAQSLLGENFGGILNSDRYSAYNWLDVDQRQLCWAHLKREFTLILRCRRHAKRTQWPIPSAWTRPTRPGEKVISLMASSARWHSHPNSVSVVSVADSRACEKFTPARG